MTTQHSEGPALEQKTVPVPSSEKMALDLDINGTATRDDSKTEQQLPSEIELNKSNEVIPSASTELSNSAPEVNGDMNAKAHSINSSVVASTLVESHAQESPETETLSQVPDANATANSTQPTSIEETTTTVDLPTSADSMIESAVETITAEATAVPPVVEAPVSDLRDEISPLTKEPSEDVRPPSLPQVEDKKEESPQKEEQPSPKEQQPSETIKQPSEATEQPQSAESVVQQPSEPMEQQPVEVTKEQPSEPTAQQSADSTMEEPPKDENLVEDMNLTFDEPRPDLPPSSPNNAPASVDMDMSIEQQQPQPDPTNIGPVPPPTPPTNDIDMVDAPEQPSVAKVARVREDDDDEEPSAKRTKTEESEGINGSQGVAPSVSQNNANGTSTPSNKESHPITPHVARELSKIIKNVIKTKDGKNFKDTVAILWPQFTESYAAKIEREVDLGTMERSVREGTYRTIEEFKADINLLVSNAITFNGEDNLIADAARGVKTQILSKMSTMPPEPAPHIAKPTKKAKKPNPSIDTTTAAVRAPTVRRPSRGSSGVAAPVNSSATTFALDPVTSTPLIRRDSTKDGRPKREIHPPKNKDLPYSSTRPKSKKFSLELKWCEDALAELKKAKHIEYSGPFLQPVDPVALQIPNYFTIIKTPMDISVVSEKLQTGAYSRAKEFEQDVKLIFQNCYKFNPEGNSVRDMGKRYESVFNAFLAKKDRWIAERQPPAQSPEREVESEEEESEEEAPPAPGSSNPSFTERLVEEQNKLIDMLSRGEDPDVIKMQKDMISIIKKRIDDLSASAAKKPPKKSKPAKPTKKVATAPPPKKTSSGNTKKAGGARRDRYMGTFEKEVISSGIGALPEHVSAHVMTMIKEDQPTIVTDDDGTMELDIDLISSPILWKIFEYIKEFAPDVEATVREGYEKKEETRAPAKPLQKKKNKPMSKNEQESKIDQLRKKVDEFKGVGSRSQEPIQSVEQPEPEESSGDESSDSEEE